MKQKRRKPKDGLGPAHPTKLSAEMRAAVATRAVCGPGIRAISRHGN
jgi:hypothetical protein